VNFATSADSLRLQTDATAGLSFRSVTLGGGLGAGNAGGTIVLSAGGITNVMVNGTLNRAPANLSATGGGFRGTGAKSSRVTVDGDLVSTSVATLQPILFGPGTNRLELAGASPQLLSFAMSARVIDDGATLRVLNSNGVTLGGTGLVYSLVGTLELLSGNLAAGGDTLAIPAGSALTATGGHVNGALRKYVPAGAGVSVPFEIGSGPAATPLSLLFANVSTGGDVTASTVSAEHPDIANSMIQSPRDANRTWSLLNAGVAFDRYDITLTYDPADLDAPAVTDSFVVRRYDGATWWPARVGARTATSITATGMPAFSDFVTGNPDSFLVAASATGGSVTPSGIVRIAPGADAVFTAAADPGYTMLGWVADGVTSAPADTFTFAAVSEDHFLAPSFADTIPPVVQLTSPVGGETFTVGQSYNVTWSASDNVAVTSVDLLLSRNGAAGTYTAVATGIANSGSFSWTVSGPATANAFFEVVAHDAGGHAVSDVSDSAFTLTRVNAVPDGPVATLSFSPVAPNPVRQHGTFAFGLPAAAHVRLTVLDIQGRAVAELANGTFEPGRHQVRWDAAARGGAAPGVYFARLQTSGRQFVQRFVIER